MSDDNFDIIDLIPPELLPALAAMLQDDDPEPNWIIVGNQDACQNCGVAVTDREAHKRLHSYLNSIGTHMREIDQKLSAMTTVIVALGDWMEENHPGWLQGDGLKWDPNV